MVKAHINVLEEYKSRLTTHIRRHCHIIVLQQRRRITNANAIAPNNFNGGQNFIQLLTFLLDVKIEYLYVLKT